MPGWPTLILQCFRANSMRLSSSRSSFPRTGWPMHSTFPARYLVLVNLTIEHISPQLISSSPGPCPVGQMVFKNSSGLTECVPADCRNNASPGSDNSTLPQLVRAYDGRCYALGTQGPCPPRHLFGYDTYLEWPVCVDTMDYTSPYFTSPEELALVDKLYTNKAAEYSDYQAVLIYGNKFPKKYRPGRRQGVFQASSASPSTLLSASGGGGKGASPAM